MSSQVPPLWYWMRKRIYIFSSLRPVPGIEPRIPTISGLSAALQASTVAQRWRETTVFGVTTTGFLVFAGVFVLGLPAASAGPARASGSAANIMILESRSTAADDT